VEHERDALGRGQAVDDDLQRERHRLGEQHLVLGAGGEPGGLDLDRHLVPVAPAAQHVQADPARHRRQPRAQVLDAVGAGPAQPQPRLLDRVVGIVGGAEHAQRHRPQIGALAFEFGDHVSKTLPGPQT
jgi:hypothetical protein